MIPVLYSPNAIDFTSFGLGALTRYHILRSHRGAKRRVRMPAQISGERPALRTHHQGMYHQGKAHPPPPQDQAFRIYRITKPLKGIVSIYGQHISYGPCQCSCADVFNGKLLSAAYPLAASFGRHTIYGLDGLFGCKTVFGGTAAKRPRLLGLNGRLYVIEVAW